MKSKSNRFSLQDLTDKGFVEAKPNHFFPVHCVQDFAESVTKISKKVTKKRKGVQKLPKIDLFIILVKSELDIDLVPEFKFNPERNWRFDYAIPELKIAIEQEGGVWSNGRHTRGKGFINDMEKYNQAALLDWTLIRRTPDQMLTNETLELIRQAIKL